MTKTTVGGVDEPLTEDESVGFNWTFILRIVTEYNQRGVGGLEKGNEWQMVMTASSV